MHLSITCLQVFVVQAAYFFQLFFQRRNQTFRHGHHAILFAFSIAYNNLLIIKIQIAYTQAYAFH